MQGNLIPVACVVSPTVDEHHERLVGVAPIHIVQFQALGIKIMGRWSHNRQIEHGCIPPAVSSCLLGPVIPENLYVDNQPSPSPLPR
jgi:hypothetical protein